MSTTNATKRAFIVLGAESSGTRMLTSILIAGGCHGSIEHVQPIDDPSYDISPYRDVVWRRSVPHGGELLNLPALIDRLNVQGERQIIVVSISRNRDCNAKSQVWWGHASDYDLACERIDAANNSIEQTTFENRVAVQYETFVTAPSQSQKALWSLLGLAGGEPIRIRNGNAKYRDDREVSQSKILWARTKPEGRIHFFAPGKNESGCSDHIRVIIRPGSKFKHFSPVIRPRVFEARDGLTYDCRPTDKICARCDHIYEIYQWGFNFGLETAASIVQPQPHLEEERECSSVAVQIRGKKL